MRFLVICERLITAYFGAFAKKYIPIVAKMIFGSQPAKNGEITPEMAKTLKNSRKRMYAKVIVIPIPRLIPMPPLVLRLDSDAPIIVRMIMAAGDANLLCFSIS